MTLVDKEMRIVSQEMGGEVIMPPVPVVVPDSRPDENPVKIAPVIKPVKAQVAPKPVRKRTQPPVERKESTGPQDPEVGPLLALL